MGQSVEQVQETREAKARFLAHFGQMGNITAACEAAGIGRRARVYDWRDEDPDFEAAYQEAEAAAVGRLEAVAWQRATVGVERPVFQQGRQVGVVREYSDALMVVLLKAHARAKYGDRLDVQAAAAAAGEPEDRLTVEERQAIAAAYLALPDHNREGAARLGLVSVADLAPPEPAEDAG